MKLSALLLSFAFISTYAETHFFLVPPLDGYLALTAEDSVCPEPSMMNEAMTRVLSFAAEDCAEMEAPEVLNQVSGMTTVAENGMNGIFAGLGTWGGRRALDEGSNLRRKLPGVDCVNDCYALKLNAPPICCYICAWCVGGGGRRRELTSGSTLSASLEEEFHMVTVMPSTLACMEQRLSDQCAIVNASYPEQAPCFACDDNGNFVGALSGFVVFTGTEMDTASGAV